ncbi:DUF6097 family protein [Listeria ivanovii]|uniref:Uncharacterized protein n=1 Tax=Listeria ivanovii (strain ATCC BAA-678 / PAM 55) TaxID=881621 RepID=G2ZCC8_LISIP|nr:DUF6097 family protein [Listeria ivanovii]AHI57217.1 hypothetical protein AX25_14575 [Listeria ivanovii WSLC3009]AIS66644.1 hypothetical protein JL52_14345 [Listeria ivanovii subsp. ivanovii]MBC1759685.1 hypothetical protein [Listeria ivanovii]MBK3914820.1 hypothetical protein [Listeria ivanovii subsp. ivanovii]MBK3922020.1 hypothetical protein [Listeria ivanovii subsp. ivanovii]
MIQLVIIILLIVLVVLMPKNNKEEVKAAHLLIDKYAMPVAKKKNPVRQLALLEKQLGVSTYRASRKKTLLFIPLFFVLVIALGALAVFFAVNNQIPAAIATGILSFLVLIAGTIILWVMAIRQASSLRTDAWAEILHKLDPSFPIEFLNEKKWQKAFLAQMESLA